jgi:hypothetical protein
MDEEAIIIQDIDIMEMKSDKLYDWMKTKETLIVQINDQIASQMQKKKEQEEYVHEMEQELLRRQNRAYDKTHIPR